MDASSHSANSLPTSPDSLYRHSIVVQHLTERELISKNDIIEVLKDRFGAPYSVCLIPSADENGEIFSTTASIIMDPEEGIMEICKAPYENTNFEKYLLT